MAFASTHHHHHHHHHHHGGYIHAENPCDRVFPTTLPSHRFIIVACSVKTQGERLIPPSSSPFPSPLTPTLDACSSARRRRSYGFGLERDREAHMLPIPTESPWFQMLTELQRSLLETQWASESGEQDICVSSGRKSARERRLLSSRNHKRRNKKKKTTKKKENFEDSSNEGNQVMNSLPLTSCSRVRPLVSGEGGPSTWIDAALASVTTLGLKGTRELLTKEEEIILSKKLKAGLNLKSVRTKLTQIIGSEPSDGVWASTVNMSFIQVQGKILEADRARDQLLVSNMRLVFSVANKYTGHGLSFSELVQEGAVGLIRGLEKFDHTKGFRLSTYVHWWIWQGITRALAGQSRTVRLPAHIHNRLGVINKAAQALTMDRKPISVKSLSHAVNMPEETVTVALKATKRMLSFDKAKRWGPFCSKDTLHSYVADTHPESDPWVLVEKKSMREDVDDLLGKMLNQREREIVRLHYGLGHADGKALSLRKISHRFGISRERIRQIEDCAMHKLVAVGRKIDFHAPLTC